MARGRLAGKVSIVTGAGSGMGAAAARALAREGASVVAADLNVGAAEAIAAEVTSAGGEALAVEVDVSRAADVRRMVDATTNRFGTVDVLACIAGVLRTSRIDQIAEAEWDLVLDVNLKGVFLCAQAVLPVMKAQRAGKIVILASLAGRATSTLGGAHYTASKAGMLGLTRAAAKELGKYGVTVNAVCPGMIDTELTHENASDELLARLAAGYPVPRVGTAREVADLICFAASEAAGYVTGASLDINGGDLMM
jgi:3-oxoacyl-[acyl-carrier protein] reductase